MNEQELFERHLEGDAAVREQVEGDADLLRQALEHEKMESALRVLHEGEDAREWRVRAIMADIRGEAEETSVRRMRRSIGWQRHLGWLSGLAASLVALIGVGWWALRPPAPIPVQTGDSLVLHAGESGRYSMTDGTVFKLDGPADLTVGRTLRLREGRLTVDAAKHLPGDPLIVLAPHARSEVLGTRFRMEATKRGTRLDVTEGQVRFVANGAGAQVLGRGETAASLAASRDPVYQPFASDSPWNTSIGSSARFDPVPTLNLAAGVHVESREWAVPVYVASATDPVRTLYYSSSRISAGQVRVDPAIPVLDGDKNKYLALVDERLTTVWELSGASRDACGNYRAGDIGQTDLRGSGWGLAGPGHSGASLLGGLVRQGELHSGVPHALAVLVRVGTVNRSGQPFEWPASHALSDWRLYGTNGNLRLGSLLALPADIEFSGLDSPARVLAVALRDYGAYVVGTFNSGKKDIIILAECAADAELPSEVADQLAPLIMRLRRVANNTPASPGGGGEPLRPAPPPLVTLGR